jgi:hypothetical protein
MTGPHQEIHVRPAKGIRNESEALFQIRRQQAD